MTTRTESHENLHLETIPVSGCCGSYLDPVQVDHEVCPDCGEHCEIENQEWILPR